MWGWMGGIIIGGIAGWMAGRVMQSGRGIIGNSVLGIAGAVVLNFLLSLLNIYPSDAWYIQIIVGAVGAIILIWAWRLIRGRTA